MKQNNKAFTLVELIVVITILAILGTIAFISLQGYSAQARDSKRLSDIQNIKTSLELFSINTGKYPLPDGGEEVLYGVEDDVLWTQGTVGNTVSTNLSRNLNKKPTDPLTEAEYIYSTINSQTKYELLSVYESDLVGYSNLLNQSNADTADYPKIDGNYNGLFVKTTNYYVPIPSIITSENITGGITLDSINIKSQIVTGGENIPSVGTITSITGKLNINLSVYTGSLDSESTVADRLEFITQLQGAYTGSTLANQTIYSNLLAVTNNEEEIENYVDVVVLNTGIYSSSSNTTSDTTPPEGGSFIITLNGTDEITTTYLTSIILNITCPLEEGVEMYLTGSIEGITDWEECISGSKNITLNSGYGNKSISLKFRDISGNETNFVYKNINLEQIITIFGSVIQDNSYQTSNSNNWKVFTLLSASTNRDLNTIIFNGQMVASGTSTPPIGNLWLYLHKWNGSSWILVKSTNATITTYKTYNLSSSNVFSSGTYRVSSSNIGLYFDVSESGEILNASFKDISTNIELGTLTVINN